MYLYHKNHIVAKLMMYNGQPVGIEKVYDQKLLPIGLRGDTDFADQNFIVWVGQRLISEGRIHIELIRRCLGTPADLSAKSFGLSLTDCYWFVPDDRKDILTWEDVNFHDNGFVSDLLLMKQDHLETPHRSPDYTTGGVLEKYWLHTNGYSYLAKMGTMPGVQDEPVLAANEVVASRIANKIGIACVEYAPIHIGTEIGCVSECFSRRNEDIVTAQSVAYQLNTYDNHKVLSYIRDLGFSDEVSHMIMFHTLIGNQDAHLSNFALGMDADSGKYTRFVPLYDNGSSFGWNRIPYHELNLKPLNQNPSFYIQNCDTFVELPKLEILSEDVRSVYEEYHISDAQTQIALDTLAEGYQVVCDRMLELQKDGPEILR